MKKRRFFSVLLSVFLLSLLVLPVSAESFTLEMPVKVLLQGETPSRPETFRIRLKPLSPDAPMPKGSTAQGYLLSAKGPGTTAFPAITFDHPMRVSYQVEQVPGRTRYYTYDSTVYQMDVMITQTSQGLAPTVVLNRKGQEEKAGELVFTNRYDPPPKSGQPQTGDPFNLKLWVTTGTLSLLGALALSYVTFRKQEEY